MVNLNKLIPSNFAEDLITLSYQINTNNLVRLSQDVLEVMSDNEEEQKQRKNISSNTSTSFKEKKEQVYIKASKNMFVKLDNRSKKNNQNTISADKITRSTAKPLVIKHLEGRPKTNKLIQEIAALKYNRQIVSKFLIDDNNEDLYSVALNEIVCKKTDRSIIVHASNIQLSENDQGKGKVFMYEFAWVTRLHEDGNKQIANVIYEFLNSNFEKEQRHIRELLKNSDTIVIMIVNNASDTSDTLTVKNIVSLIMFGNEDVIGTCIDYIVTARPFTGLNFAPFLIHHAQLFGSKVIEQKTTSIKNNVTALLTCRRELIHYYKRIGFQEFAVDEFKNDQQFQKSVERLEVSLWNELDRSGLFVMRLNDLCPRLINYLSYFPIELEDEIYSDDKSQPFSKWSEVACSNEMSEQFLEEIVNLVDNRLYFNYNDAVKDLFRTSRDETTFFESIYSKAMELHIGNIYKTTNNLCKIANEDKRNYPKTSHLFEEALFGMKIVLIFKDINSKVELDKQECWGKVICAHCKKHAYVKKSDSDMLNDFLTQAVISIWFVHIFGLEIVPNNRWYEVNKNWNVCQSRKNHVFNRLKLAYHVDNVHLPTVDDYVGYFQSLMNLEGLWEAIDRQYRQLFYNCCRIAYIIELRTDPHLEKRTYGKTYVQRSRELLKKIAPSKSKNNEDVDDKEYKKRQNLLNRIKKKREREIKKDRHQAEQIWKDQFYNDLDLQLKFPFIEYVDVFEADMLDPVSDDYINDERKRIKKQRNKINERDHDFNHYLMYESKTTRPHVIDEDWFEDVHETTGNISHRVSKTTIDRCLKFPNKIWNLSTSDIRSIKQHVNNVKMGCQIHRIKRVKESQKEQSDEVVNFEGHVSSSKLSFIGYDRKHNYYPISQDWVELNFRISHPSLFKDIMSLRPGEACDIKSGSTNRTPNNQIDAQGPNHTITPIGPEIKFKQCNKPSCLPCSIASALVYANEEIVACRIMRYYENFIKNNTNKAFSMNDVLNITLHNKGRQKNEKRLKWNIQKVKQPNTLQLINEREHYVLYHCELINHHSVVLYQGWIFDPSVSNALPRDETHIRYSAESYSYEESQCIISLCYKYSLMI